MQYIGEPSNAGRTVRVTHSTVGSFSRGNSRSSFGPTTGIDINFTPSPGGFYGIPKQPAFFSRKPKVLPREGKLCPSCGLLRSVQNRCDCNS